VDALAIPVIVNVRDRLTPLKALVEWLEHAGHERLVLLDNFSTYEPLLEYLRSSPHTVWWTGVNNGARAFWHYGLSSPDARRVGTDWFVYTDPDCVPIEDCPLDAVPHLHELLERYPDVPKAGLGLSLADVSLDMRDYHHEKNLLGPNPPHWKGQLEPGVYHSWIDTTFALYRPGSGHGLPSIRTTYPYECRHLSPSWYPDLADEESDYYLAHALPGPLYSGWKGAHERSRA